MAHNRKKHHKKHGVKPGQTIGGPSRKRQREIVSTLAEVAQLVDAGELGEARQALLDANRRCPYQPEILDAMADIGEQMRDPHLLMAAAEDTHHLLPDDPEALLALSSSYLIGEYFALALSLDKEFLRRWPDHPDASIASTSAQVLERGFKKDFERFDLPPDQALEVMALNDRSRRYLDLDRAVDARKAALRMLDILPRFPPALNNLSMAFFLDGDLDRAIETAEQVFEFEPGNIHALANLAHWHCILGRFDQAGEFAWKLKASKEEATDRETKIAMALSFLGDDQGVLEAFDAAKAKEKKAPVPAMLYHLAGAACMRIGRQLEARRRWRRALEIDPGLDVAEENLADCDKPIGERNGPWAYDLRYWLPKRFMEDMARLAMTTSARHDDRVRKAVRELARKHPYIEAILPALFDRADAHGRGFAMMVADCLGTEKSLEEMKNFALGQKGTDRMRIDAAQLAMPAGAMPPGAARMWIKGEWREILLMGWDLYDAPTVSHSPKVARMCEKATRAIQDGATAEAETLLLQASEIEPDKPDIWNNLALVYKLEGRNAEADTLLDRISREWPDYIFGQIQKGVRLMDEDRFDEALAVLLEAGKHPRMNIEAFGALCDTMIRLHFLRKDPNAAEGWLNIRREVLDDDERTEQMAQNIQIVKALVALQEFGRRPRRGKHRDKVNA